MDDNLIKKYIPMTETTYYTLLSVLQPRHGYAIMQFVNELTKGRIQLGTGTLYTMIGRLVADDVICIAACDSSKKEYCVTDNGLQLLHKETERISSQLRDGGSILSTRGYVKEEFEEKGDKG